MKEYYNMTREELYGERLKLNNEIEIINHALSFMEVSEQNIKDMLWNRYENFKQKTNKILIVKYIGGNSCNPKCYKYYEADKISDKIYETEINSDYLFWLNNNRHYLNFEFDWL